MNPTARGIGLLLLGVASAAACNGGSNSPVLDQGSMLSPHSEAMGSTSFLGIGIVEVIVTDSPNICAAVPTVTACSVSTNPNGFTLTTGHVLGIAAVASGPGTYPIATPDAGALGALGAAQVIFINLANGQDAGVDEAVSGKVIFSTLKPSASAEGSYDVEMKSGSHLTGNFDANDCPALDSFFNFADQASCNSGTGGSGTDLTCYNDCSCMGKSVSANCNEEPDGGGWQCSCLTSSGTTTSCTLSASVSVDAACQSGTSCCPLTF